MGTGGWLGRVVLSLCVRLAFIATFAQAFAGPWAVCWGNSKSLQPSTVSRCSRNLHGIWRRGRRSVSYYRVVPTASAVKERRVVEVQPAPEQSITAYISEVAAGEVELEEVILVPVVGYPRPRAEGAQRRRRMQFAWVRNAVRGALALPANIILWAGLWIILDEHTPGGTSYVKELLLVGIGTCLMLATRTFFSNASMDDVDREGSLLEFGRLLRRQQRKGGKAITRIDRVRYYTQSSGAMVGAVLFWNGAFSFIEDITPDAVIYDMLCSFLGALGVLWVMSSQGDFNEQEDGPQEELKRALQAATPFKELPLMERSRLYLMAFAGNLSAVLYWRGCETTLESQFPDTDWTGLAFFSVGTFILWVTNRLHVNSGLSSAAALPPDPVDYLGRRGGAQNPIVEASHSIQAYYQACSRSLFGSLVEASAELVAIVLVWTGIEWYIWDSDYIQESLDRDLLYVFVSLGILIATGTFVNLSGMLSPMALYKRVHAHHFDEAAPLLSENSAQSLQQVVELVSTSSSRRGSRTFIDESSPAEDRLKLLPVDTSPNIRRSPLSRESIPVSQRAFITMDADRSGSPITGRSDVD